MSQWIDSLASDDDAEMENRFLDTPRTPTIAFFMNTILKVFDW
jgi:hypothetical protein